MSTLLLEFALAFAAGMATVASPCILPILPLLLGASATRSSGAARHRPIFIVLGFIGAFAAVVLLFGASTRVLGLSQQALRSAGAGVMLLAGILLVWPGALARVMAPFGGLADLAQRFGSRGGTGHFGALILGMSLGLLWTPCAGPILASVMALIATEQDLQQAAGLLITYAAGAGLPMLAIAYGGQAVTGRARALAGYGGLIRRGFGLLVITSAALIHWEADSAVAAWASRDWFAPSHGEAAVEPDAATRSRTAPEFAGITGWLNSAPLSMAQLRGKVVLIDFWTYACVNCINTLPHLNGWHERYKDQGLVVVGVHTPEFAFERETDNLAAAIARRGIEYPVAQDNGYRTWSAWRNQYWPSVFLVDRQGRVIFHHVGEGDYERIEAQIRAALR